jgi:hypothetical protein
MLGHPAAGRPVSQTGGIGLRTTNAIESAFATVRYRSKITEGPGSRAAGLGMAFTLTGSAQAPLAVRQRTPPGALVCNGATFANGKLAERPKQPEDLHPQVLEGAPQGRGPVPACSVRTD